MKIYLINASNSLHFKSLPSNPSHIISNKGGAAFFVVMIQSPETFLNP